MAYKHITNGLARIFGTPPYLIVFVSDRCWMKCQHCWYSEEWKQENLRRPELTLSELERLAQSLRGINFLSLTGGEAFQREEIAEITSMFLTTTRVRRYQIPTSGYRTEHILRETRKMLNANQGTPFRVDVSLDGTEQTHDHIRQIRGGFARAVETIRNLNRLKRKYPYFDVGVITTISKKNQDEIDQIGEVVRQIHPDGEWLVNITRGTPRDPTAIDINVKNYWRAHEIIEERMGDKSYRGHTGHFTASWLSAKNATRRKVIRRIVEGHSKGGGCAAGSLGGVVFNDGQVAPCEMLDMTIGYLQDFNFDLARMWNSERARQVRAWIQDTRCQCTQECFLSMSLLLQPQHWPDIVRERWKLATANR